METPIYIIEEKLFRKNLSLIASVAKRADVEIIMAFKAFALWKTFPIVREYINSTTASSLNEARLAFEEFKSPSHTYSPAYKRDEISDIARMSSHLTFNSLTQYRDMAPLALEANPDISLGLRINPEYSEVGTALYNPCAPGTRFGITHDRLPEKLPSHIEGFHCHCHCESGADVFERSLEHIEKLFSPWFGQIKWINFGGGHLMTRKDYDVELLIRLMQDFHAKYPHLKVILEPGSAFAWQTGTLVASVIDIVTDHDIKTAILDVSFTCHMPDCLEMPYQPAVRGAVSLQEADYPDPAMRPPHVYRLGGNSCLSGDYMGLWQFDHELQLGEQVIFEDMIHYTTVKTTMFNGIQHPSIVLRRLDGSDELLRRFTYDDYRSRMS